MIHKYALIAEFEYDDENGEYESPSSREVENGIGSAMYRWIKWSGLTETHFEVSRGTLHQAFGVPEYDKK